MQNPISFYLLAFGNPDLRTGAMKLAQMGNKVCILLRKDPTNHIPLFYFAASGG
jgi:hypothetical protein